MGPQERFREVHTYIFSVPGPSNPDNPWPSPLKIDIFTIFKYFLDDDDDHPGYPNPPSHRTQEKNTV